MYVGANIRNSYRRTPYLRYTAEWPQYTVYGRSDPNRRTAYYTDTAV